MADALNEGEVPFAAKDVVHDKHEHPDTISRNARYGLVLFVIYLLFYGAFVGVSAFSPEFMGKPAFWGVNVAVIYGFSLIAAAIVLSLVYMWLCKSPHANADKPRSGRTP